ncbi:unnamed protein product [Urochloa decumbens]|uniref:VQ domain-containing protein n=1 Tax=Urochloa decumbens TaxID=240449 RepID=A0ABC8WUK9_9POAL
MRCASASPLFIRTRSPSIPFSRPGTHRQPPTGQLPHMSPTPPRPQPGAGAGAGGGGSRHAAFKVHRDSHSIHKQAAATSPPSSSSTNSSVSSSSPNAAASANSRRPPPAPAPRQTKPPAPPPQQQPVIIYTHSPKVIRTNPRDFMSIVQKLTGLDSPGGPARGAAPPPAARVTAGTVAAAAQDESSSSSSESCAANAHAAGPPPYADSSQLMPPPAAPPLDAHFMAPDIPLFAPDASELHHLCAAPRGLYGQFPPPVDATALGGPVMSAANVHGGNAGAAVFSPSMVEAMRAFPDYN